MALWTGMDSQPANAIPIASDIVAISKEVSRSAFGIYDKIKFTQ